MIISKKLYSKLFLTSSVFALLFSLVFSYQVNAAGEQTNVDEIQLEDDLATSLELIYGDAVAVDSEGVIIGYKKEVLKRGLKDNSLYEEIISGLEEENLLISETDSRLNEIKISPRVANCAWHFKKNSAAYDKAATDCIVDGLKSNYSLTAIGASLSNAIFNKQFVQAAGIILKLGIKSNVAGVVVVLSVIQVTCSNKMEKKFPGSSNCD
ncbi:hypothetical protein [Viridibacillus arvi]|uniref:hypothetical protein n=1 Tax=Viridibacillus arvi TaxID=263475 RepID=UPI003D2B3E7B